MRWRLRKQSLSTSSSPQQWCSLGKRVRPALAMVFLVVELDHEGSAGDRSLGPAHCYAPTYCSCSHVTLCCFQTFLKGEAAVGKTKAHSIFRVTLGAIFMLAAYEGNRTNGRLITTYHTHFIQQSAYYQMFLITLHNITVKWKFGYLG